MNYFLWQVARIASICAAVAAVLDCGTSNPTPVAERTTATTQAVAAPDAGPPQQQITIASTPNAKCTLNSRGATMPAWADDSGIVHLWASPTSTSDQYTLDCDEAGTAVQYPFDLANPATFVPASARFIPMARKIRPALTDPAGPSPAEIISAGYPPRPDPKLAPEMYQNWLAVVSTPAVIVPPFLVELPDRTFGPAQPWNSPAWCGLAMDQAARYTYSSAYFYIPQFGPYGATYESTIWGGLGGADNDDIIQDGVDYESLYGVGTYTPWYEYYWKKPVGNFNMNVAPNDFMVEYAWEADASCNNVPGGGYACFLYEDETPNPPLSFASGPIQAPDANFTGWTAEAIIEKQPYYALAPWAGANVALYATDSNGQSHTFNSDAYLNATLVNGSGQALCISGQMSAAQASFWWEGPQ